MRDIFIVMKFTMKEMLTRKSFIITTVLLLVLIIIGFNIPNLLEVFGGNRSDTNLILISDPDAVFGHQINSLNSSDSIDYHFEETNLSGDELRRAIEDDTAATAIIISQNSPNNYNLYFLIQNPVLDAKDRHRRFYAPTTVLSSPQTW